MSERIDKLRPRIAGEVRTDPYSRLHYSVDASLYQIEPLAVVLPKSVEDVAATVAFAREEGIPVIARGSGTGIAGGCVGRGIVIDLSRHLQRILEIDPERRVAVIEPGVIQDQLNAAAAPHGLRFGPDTSTGNRATVGGMFGNNSSGAHSMRYGKTSDNVLAADFLLAGGETLHLGEQTAADLSRLAAGSDALARVARLLVSIRRDLADEIRERFPKIQRRVSGYNLDDMLADPLNLTRLACGAEGTLGIATRLTVKLSPSPKAIGLSVVHVEDVIAGLRAVPFILGHEPFALELIDDHIIEMGKQSPAMGRKLGWLDGHPGGLLVAEFDGDSEAEVFAKLNRFEHACRREKLGYSHVRLTRKSDIANVWDLRKAGLGLLLSRRSPEKAIAFLEDSAVPPERVGEFMAEFREYLRKAGREAGFYGHAGVGLIHVRPMIDLHRQEDLDLMVRMMQDVADLLLGYGGSLSGEHGDGLIRSWLIERMFGPRLTRAFAEVKAAFDPERLMNPGKIVDPPPPTHDLRVSPQTLELTVPTNLYFEGGLALAAGMCNGNAECRKPEGLMCPSFQAANDEFHSTRARATSMQAVLTGRFPPDELTGRGMYEVMDLCLQCKGCQTDCPSRVDVARMKSEFLYQYQKKHGVPLRSRLFGNIDLVSRLAAPVAGLVNRLLTTRVSKAVMERVGITARRAMPTFARQRFSTWLRRRGGPRPGTGDAVALFTDTFTEFNYPEIGQAAIRLLEALNCRIVVPRYACCGRPAISKGLLDDARRRARRVQAVYLPLVDQGYRIVGLEPSCILTFRDEHPALLPGAPAARIAGAALTVDEYLHQRLEAHTLDLPWRTDAPAVQVLLHGHCHQKAQVGTNPTLAVLRAVPGFEVKEIPSGCCGMAGTFGYESEHYEFSLRVGELKLFPAVRASAPGTILVASGLSCRSQIEHGTGRQGQHLVQVLADRLGEPPPAVEPPLATPPAAPPTAAAGEPAAASPAESAGPTTTGGESVTP